MNLYQDEDFNCNEINYAVGKEFRDAKDILESDIEETIKNDSVNSWRDDPEKLEKLMFNLREYKFLRAIVGSATVEESEEAFYHYSNNLAKQVLEIIKKKNRLQKEKSAENVSEAKDMLPF